MGQMVDNIPYRPYLNRDRLIYVTHPDTLLMKQLCDEFIAQGVQVSVLPDLKALGQQVVFRRPDLVLMPLEDNPVSLAEVLAAVAAIRSQHLGIHSFLLAPAGIRAEHVVQAMRQGATWVFSPPYVPVEIARTAQEIFRGDLHVEADRQGGEAVTVRGFGTLTFRERQILQFVVDGHTNKEIAAALGLSYRTIEVHRRHIMEKTGARNTAELVRLAIES